MEINYGNKNAGQPVERIGYGTPVIVSCDANMSMPIIRMVINGSTEVNHVLLVNLKDGTIKHFPFGTLANPVNAKIVME